MKSRLLLFGAGRIGRSFVGQLFARGGYEVVFVDVDERVVRELNRRTAYDVVVKHPDGHDETLRVTGVRAVDARDEHAVAAEVAAADLAATAVGAAALPSVARLLRAGIARRHTTRGSVPLDVILAENAHDADAVVRAMIENGGEGRALSAITGLVRTSIGKMVPIVPAAVAERDPLIVFAEPYNTLVVDEAGFLGPVPAVRGVKPVGDIAAYVDRKLYLHNLGHAAAAYLGFLAAERSVTIHEALAAPGVREGAFAAMTESAEALLREHGSAFTRDDLYRHRDDLLRRFENRALGDTVYRVGRDLPRKLARDDRLVGAMLLAARHGCPFSAIARVYLAALRFRAADESGRVDEGDERVVRLCEERGVEAAMRDVSGLRPDSEPDATVMRALR
ncbi:MAG: NAD-binding protein [Spirochaetota bacterium]